MWRSNSDSADFPLVDLERNAGAALANPLLGIPNSDLFSVARLRKWLELCVLRQNGFFSIRFLRHRPSRLPFFIGVGIGPCPTALNLLESPYTPVSICPLTGLSDSLSSLARQSRRGR